MLIEIQKKMYHVMDGEFSDIPNETIHPLVVRENISEFDRDIGFIKELRKVFKNILLVDYETTHGGYVPLNVSFDNTCIVPKDAVHSLNISQNLKLFKTSTELLFQIPDLNPNQFNIIRINEGCQLSHADRFDMILSSNNYVHTDNYIQIKFNDKYIYLHPKHFSRFQSYFKNTFDHKTNTLHFDNLINVLFMVKNAGDGFREVLQKNKPYMDTWTILDTGSTDNTINIINETLYDMKGNLYQEPFLNFRDSRNRLFELAKKEHAFNIMLDDTYVLNGNIRQFLSHVRADDFADSYSIYIFNTDSKYGSVRVTKPYLESKYQFTIHEIPDCITSVILPIEYGNIFDVDSEYMVKRTNDRKQYDLDRLFSDLIEYPDEKSRLYYYIAETYYCLDDMDNAIKYYEIRGDMEEGYREEKHDSLYKKAVFKYEYKKGSFEKCKEELLECFKVDPKRYDPIFMIGWYANLNGDNITAYEYLKRAFEIGEPSREYGMNIKLMQCNWHLPRALVILAYHNKNYELGMKCVERALKYFETNGSLDLDDVTTIHMWKTIYALLLEDNKIKSDVYREKKIFEDNKKLIVMVAGGGWTRWDGSTLTKSGLGGSETCVIKYSEELVKNNNYNVIVFCDCEEEICYNGVSYKKIVNVIRFINEYVVDYAVLHRYSEYIPVFVENKLRTYMVFHDLSRRGEIIPINDHLQKVICLSDWHCEYIGIEFPVFKNKICKISYGIDMNYLNNMEKIKHSFIYSSFPSRGLLWLLRLFPKITKRYPDATLNIFCDLDHEWSNRVAGDQMIEIKKLLLEQTNVFNHGWVNKKVLNAYWEITHVWFYPCIFNETFCLTALEAAASKTLIVCPKLAALEDTRGVFVEYEDVNKNTFGDKALNTLYKVLDDPKLYNKYIDDCYERAISKSYKAVVSDFLKLL